MKEKKDIATLIQEAVDEVIKFGTIPYVIICNKKTWEKAALYFRSCLSPIEEKFMPLQIWFKYEGGDLPFLKFKYCPDDTVYVLDKDTYERLMKQTSGKLSLSSYFETVTYHARGLIYDFGKKTIIKRIC